MSAIRHALRSAAEMRFCTSKRNLGSSNPQDLIAVTHVVCECAYIDLARSGLEFASKTLYQITTEGGQILCRD